MCSLKPSINYETPSGTLTRADWYALQLLNHLRLLLLVAGAAAFYLMDGWGVLGSRAEGLFKYTHLLWLILALGFNSSIKLRRPSLETQFYIQSYIDILMLAVLMFASGGVESGLGILMVVHIAIISNFAKTRYTILFAAIASTVALSQELIGRGLLGEETSNLVQTAILGATLFFVALFTSLIVKRYPANSGEATSRTLSVRQMAELNQQIVREIDSGVLHVDSEDRLQLINESGAFMLSTQGLNLPTHLGLVSEPIYHSLRQWRKNPASANRAISHSSLAMEVLPQFTRLNDGGTLIKLDDQTAMKTQLQQLKLASLGRLSTSIAHEIRNPLGAISNAVQLLAESPDLPAEDLRLINIALNHSDRINRIVEDIMSLSTRAETKTETCFLNQTLLSFRKRFLEQHNLPDTCLEIELKDTINTEFDLTHLDQILWNLCNNALVHNDAQTPEITIVAYLDGTGCVIEVMDNGNGISESEREQIFEPFFTTRHSGTGLGLYIIRELCELNRAHIELVPMATGACFRITLAPPRAMAA